MGTGHLSHNKLKLNKQMRDDGFGGGFYLKHATTTTSKEGVQFKVLRHIDIPQSPRVPANSLRQEICRNESCTKYEISFSP